MSKDEKIVFAKGGTAQHTKTAEEVQIPDLWHIAEALAKDPNYHKSCSEKVLECWHTCHSLLQHIRER